VPDPLAALDARDITSVKLFASGEVQATEIERRRAIAAAVASLRNAPRLDGRRINWAGATQVQARTADGLILSLQVVPADAGAVARVTADPAPGVEGATARAAAIRALRHNAYKLNHAAAAALLHGPASTPTR
jgi:hypothetical protein